MVTTGKIGAVARRGGLRLGVDLDGVVCDFNAGWMRLHMEEFGSELHPEMVVTWDNLHDLGGFADMESFWRWAQGNADRPSIFRHLEPYPEAIETLHALRDVGHDIVVVTAKPRWAVPDTLRWMADHDLPTSEIHIRFRKYLVDCDVYLDDSPIVLPELVEHRPAAMVCRMVRPWNGPVVGAHDVVDWPAFAAFVRQIGRRGRSTR
jgi:5'(3')-deoxyribonucleotidase